MHTLQLRTLLLLTTLSSLACTSNQDLGDRDNDGGTNSVGDGDGDQGSDDDPIKKPQDDDDGEDNAMSGEEDSPEAEFEVGTFAGYSAAASGLSIPEFGDYVSVTVTSLEGNLGCALTTNLGAAPGTAASSTAVVFEPESGDERCPPGVFAVRNDPDLCERGQSGGCALYRRWDEEGNEVAKVLARGGYVSITATEESEELTRCDVEVNVNFAGGSVKKSFSFSFNPFEPTQDFCAK